MTARAPELPASGLPLAGGASGASISRVGGRRAQLFALTLGAGVLMGCATGNAPTDGGTDAGPAADAGEPTTLTRLPDTLSETGLYAAETGGAYAPDVTTFEVRFTSWVDDAAKRRHLRLPAGTQIDTSDPDRWLFPEGTQVWKEFFVDGRAVETRLLLKTGPGFGEWSYTTYLWRRDGTDADNAPDGEPDALGTPHDVPDQEGCLECHQGAADFPLGLTAIQLTRASFDRLVANGALPRGTRFGVIPGTTVEREALGYLHANCGHCHVDDHPASEGRDLRLDLTSAVRDVTQSNAYLTAVNGIATDRVDGTRVWIVPGDPTMSQVLARMGQRGLVGMPPRFTEEVDGYGVEAVRAWIQAM